MGRLVHGFVARSRQWTRWVDQFVGSWVCGAISPSRGGDEDGDRFVGSWCDLASGRGGSISSWVRGAISPTRGGDEDGDLTSAISNLTARSLSFSLCLRVCESFLSLSLSFSLCVSPKMIRR